MCRLQPLKEEVELATILGRLLDERIPQPIQLGRQEVMTGVVADNDWDLEPNGGCNDQNMT